MESCLMGISLGGRGMVMFGLGFWFNQDSGERSLNGGQLSLVSLGLVLGVCLVIDSGRDRDKSKLAKPPDVSACSSSQDRPDDFTSYHLDIL